MQWLLSRVVRLRPRAKTLLDIGAGTGLLVHEARARGLEAVGIEPSRSLVRSARRIHDVELLEGYFPHPAIADRTFDIITMIDVIEHVTEPVTLLRDAARALVSDGMLLVTTPDVGSLAARFLKHRWWHFRLAHVGYFNRVTLLRAADRADLQAVQMWRPKWFFRIGYVAMRLEHYLPIGLINRAARKLPAGRWLYRRVVPINPHDSLAVFLQRRT
jgi:SAM-dependent methyltransferase